jgi:Right handed beta helix region
MNRSVRMGKEMMKSMETLWMFGVIMVLASPVLAQPPITVDCDQGETVAKALTQAKPNDTIVVTGTCVEQVTVTVDRVTLDGGGTAVLDGGGGGVPDFTLDGVITVDGAQGVTITGFTVQNGPADGIAGKRGAAFVVHNTTVQDNADDGIQVADNSTAEVSNCSVLHNGERGMVAIFSSNMSLRGPVVSQNNGNAGLFVVSSNVTFIEGAVDMNDNGAVGIFAATGGVVTTTRLGPVITTNGNAGNGIGLAFGGGLLANGGTIGAANNGGSGIDVAYGANLTLLPGTTVSLNTNTKAGLNVGDASQVLAIGTAATPLAMADNTMAGVAVDNSSVRIMGATIDNNGGADVSLAFGARATLLNNMIGTISCDGTELLRGAACSP